MDIDSIVKLVRDNLDKLKTPKTKKSRIFKIDYFLFNLVVSKKRENKIKDEIYFSYDKEFGEYEHGLLLSKIMKQFSYKIEILGNIKAMIDEKFLK